MWCCGRSGSGRPADFAKWGRALAPTSLHFTSLAHVVRLSTENHTPLVIGRQAELPKDIVCELTSTRHDRRRYRTKRTSCTVRSLHVGHTKAWKGIGRAYRKIAGWKKCVVVYDSFRSRQWPKVTPSSKASTLSPRVLICALYSAQPAGHLLWMRSKKRRMTSLMIVDLWTELHTLKRNPNWCTEEGHQRSLVLRERTPAG